MARLLEPPERDSPNMRAVILSALTNASPTPLLAPSLLGRPAAPTAGPVRLPVLTD